MANNFKPVLDRNMWIGTQPAPLSHAAGACLCSDLRNDFFRNPNYYFLQAATVLYRFNIMTKGWQQLTSPASQAMAAGASIVYAPSRFLTGTITTGASTTSIPTSTSLATTPWLNQFASMGGQGLYGWKIRIIGLASGKTEERYIIGNTATATPTFLLDSPLTFTPANNDQYEIMAGRVMILGAGALAAATWRAMDVTSTAYSGLSNTNLAATIGTDSALVALDEQYVPYNHNPGEGFVKGTYQYTRNIFPLFALTATASGASTITGQASGGDLGVLANEYRNFQIRIVEDTVTPGANGQRRIIASHTAGPSPVYTLGTAWTTQPSSSAKFVIEYPNLILCRTGAQTTTYTYNYGPVTISNGTNSIAANAWSTTYFAAGPAANNVGNLWMPCFPIQPETQKNSRHSYLYFIRGGNVSTIDLLDIANTITGTFTGAITYDNPTNFSTGNCGSPGVVSNQGKFFYLNNYTQNALNQIFRFDVQNRVFVPYTPTDWIQTGAAAVGNRLVSYVGFDGVNKNDVLSLMVCASNIMQEIIVQV